MKKNTRIAFASLIALGAGTTRSVADNFTWANNIGAWETPNLWTGPIGAYPDSVLDTATVTGLASEVYLNANLSVGAMNIVGGASVFPGDYSIFVSGDVNLNGAGSRIVVRDSPSPRDFDVDTLDIDHAFFIMAGGLAQIDTELVVQDGEILGGGVIEMNSTTGDLEIVGHGVIWADGPESYGGSLTLRRTNSSTSRFNWSSPNAVIVASNGNSLINELPYTGALGGAISIHANGGESSFISQSGFVAESLSNIALTGDGSQSKARLEAPVVDSYGTIQIWSHTAIDAPITVLRGEINMAGDSRLAMPASLLILDSADFTASGEGSIIDLMSQPESTLNVTGGTTTINLGPGSHLDLDGAGDKTVNIAHDSTLSLIVETLDLGSSPSFGGTLNIDGVLHVEQIGTGTRWASDGEIVLDGGTLSGRRLDNDGIIRGNGYIDSFVSNRGEMIAEGGTLEVRLVDLDGDDTVEDGVLRVQEGDLVMTNLSDGAFHSFSGSAFVGNGFGIREVLQMDLELIVVEDNGARGSLHLNSGFVVLDDFSQNGDLVVEGTSMLRTTGNDPEDRIEFTSSGVNTINGTLEVDGDTWIVPGASFVGEGTIDAVSTVERTVFQEDSDLSDVGFRSAGEVNIASWMQDGVATMGSLTLESTADLYIHMSDILDVITTEHYVVHDEATLDGTLMLDWVGGEPAPVGETVTIIEAGSIVGAFQEVDDSGLGFNRRAFVIYDNDSVEVFVTCGADVNADGVVDFFDVLAFLSQFESDDPAADVNEDAVLDFFDVQMFLALYDLGCG